MEQKKFNGEPEIIAANEPHMALLFLVDTSGSMGGEPIDELNKGLNRFKSEVCEDKKARDILDIAIVEFNDEMKVVQEFTPVPSMTEINLVAGGSTTMTPAILKALDMVNERSRFYRRMAEPYKPWIILISDGAPTDDITSAAKKIKEMEENGKVSFRSLGVGEYDSKTLHTLCGPKVAKMLGTDFKAYFDWVKKSMRSVSLSSPGTKPKAEAFTGNVVVDTENWD